MISNTSRIIFRGQRYCVLSTVCPSLKGSTHFPGNDLNSINVGCARFINDSVEPVDVVKAAVTKHRTKTPVVPKVTLVDSQDNIISVTTVDEAEKIAESRNLKLIKIANYEVHTHRAIYKLMSEAEYLQEELKIKRELKAEKKKNKHSHIKGEKVMLMSAKINEHDLEMKLKKSLKWVEKSYEVRVVISGSAENTTPQEEIFKKFEKAFENVAKIQKRIKNGDLKFAIQPPKPVAKVQPADNSEQVPPHTTTNSDETTRTEINSIVENEVIKESSEV